jgi:hypothetical protein
MEPLSSTKLTTRERALVVAALLHHGSRAPTVLGRMEPPAAERCGAAAEALLSLPGPGRAAALAREAARLFAPLPPGTERIHPTWLADAVADVPPELRPAMLSGLGDAAVAAFRLLDAPAHGGSPAAASPQPPVLAWLKRRAFGGFVAMPEAGAPHGAPNLDDLDDLDDLPRLEPAALEERLAALGRERLALGLRRAPRAAVAALCARLDPSEAAALLEAVRAAPEDASQARQALREIGDACAGHGPLAGGGRELLLRAGARVLGHAAGGHGDLLRQIAQRLPRDRGMMVLEEAERQGTLPSDTERVDSRPKE